MKKIFKTAGPYLWRYRRGLALGLGALAVKDVMQAALPLVIRSGVDALTKGFRIELVFEFAALAGAAFDHQRDLPILDARDPDWHFPRRRV